MAPPSDADVPVSVDRWAVRLDEPAAPVPAPSDEDPDESAFPLFTLEVPTIEFRPRLSRFGEAA